MHLSELRPYLDKLPYDKYYQDITCIGFRGYSVSHKTWAAIKDEVDWADKKVADLGCFHGYFSFQAAKLRAIVTGFEKSADVLKTLAIINELESNIISTQQWSDANPITERFDVVLCLNVLHHFVDPDNALRNLNCDIAIFEINEVQEEIIKRYFEIKKRIPSHREKRIILVTHKLPNLSLATFTESRVFVTGIYGSGKTIYAKVHARDFGLKYIDFDKYYTYAKINPNLSASAEDNFFNVLADRFVTDAIPFAENGSTKRFIQYARENAVLIVCCVCPDKDVWASRIQAVKKVTADASRYTHFCNFYYNTLPLYSEFKIVYYDTYANEYITREQMHGRISWLKPLLEFI